MAFEIPVVFKPKGMTKVQAFVDKIKSDMEMSPQEKGKREGGGVGGMIAGVAGIGALAGGTLAAIGFIASQFKPLVKIVSNIAKILIRLLQPVVDVVMILLLPVLQILKPILKVVQQIIAPFRKAALMFAKQSAIARKEGRIGEASALTALSIGESLLGLQAVLGKLFLAVSGSIVQGVATMLGKLASVIVNFFQGLFGATEEQKAETAENIQSFFSGMGTVIVDAMELGVSLVIGKAAESLATAGAKLGVDTGKMYMQQLATIRKFLLGGDENSFSGIFDEFSLKSLTKVKDALDENLLGDNSLTAVFKSFSQGINTEISGINTGLDSFINKLRELNDELNGGDERESKSRRFIFSPGGEIGGYATRSL